MSFAGILLDRLPQLRQGNRNPIAHLLAQERVLQERRRLRTALHAYHSFTVHLEGLATPADVNLRGLAPGHLPPLYVFTFRIDHSVWLITVALRNINEFLYETSKFYHGFYLRNPGARF